MVHPSNDHPDLHEGIPTREQLDAMSTAELLEALEQTLFSMTEENYDGGLLDAYLDELDRKSPMPEHPATDESYERFKARVGKMNAAINPPSPSHGTRRCALRWSPSLPLRACSPAWSWFRPPAWTCSAPSPAGRTACSASAP